MMRLSKLVSLYFACKSWMRERFRVGSTYSILKPSRLLKRTSFMRLRRSPKIWLTGDRKVGEEMMMTSSGFLNSFSTARVCPARENFCEREKSLRS